MIQAVTVTTGARLHFGLYAFGESRTRQYGGMGAMIDVPLRIRAQRSLPSSTFTSEGPLAERVIEFAQRWASSVMTAQSDNDAFVQRAREQLHQGMRAAIRVDAAPSSHAGLGSGTQLGLAVSTALFQLLGEGIPSLDQCASAVGRGLRSAVGTYGFFYGGLIVDQGKREGESVSPLQCRLTMPWPWHWVLVKPRDAQGLSGEQERFAFERVPAISLSESEVLRRMIVEQVLPTLRRGDHEAFSEGLFDYGRRAGESFSVIQGGPYRNGSVTQWIERLRSWGWKGVGQSSWGPTIFVSCPDRESAVSLVEQIERSGDVEEAVVVANRPQRFDISTCEA